MKLPFFKKLESFLCDKFNLVDIDLSISLRQCPNYVKNSTLMIDCLKLSKEIGIDSKFLLDNIISYFHNSEDVVDFENINSFINFNLKSEILFENIVEFCINYVKSNNSIINNTKKILVEYSAPNTNKPMHLGHVRNNIIGMSLINLLRRIGHKVNAVNLINDRGIHICKSMVAYKMFGNNQTPSCVQKKGDHFVGDFYVKFNNEISKQIEEFKDLHKEFKNSGENDLFQMVELGILARDMLLKWELYDNDTIKLWKKMNEWVIQGFYETYDKMGTFFDKVYFESEIYKLGKQVIEYGVEEGFFEKRNDGSVYVDLTKSNLGKKTLLRSDGTSVYITQDLGLTLQKYRDYKVDQQIWIVGNEQKHYFDTLFETMKFIKESKSTYFHLSYGMVNLPHGKMKSREGNVVDADDIFDNVKNIAKKLIIEKNNIKLSKDINECSEIISMGAIKFMFMKYSPTTDLIFDPDSIIKLEGDTGPYIQYTCVRINSIMKRLSYDEVDCNVEDFNYKHKNDIDWSLLIKKEEQNIAILIIRYLDILLESSKKMDCSILAGYLLKLSKSFNLFYKECPIILIKSDKLQKTRIMLCLIVKEIIKDACKIFTIEIPAKM